MQFDEKQLQAINLCSDMSKRIVAITGEAGTGKTKKNLVLNMMNNII